MLITRLKLHEKEGSWWPYIPILSCEGDEEIDNDTTMPAKFIASFYKMVELIR